MSSASDNPQTTEPDFLLLKWGSLKAWRLSKTESLELLKKWGEGGICTSAAMQRDTPEQTAILCDLIRQHDGEIVNDWTGERLTTEGALDYIQNYGK